MNLVVCLAMVPDTVDELTVAADQRSLDTEFLRFKLNDPDEHALEQALLLKEKYGGQVTVVALEAPEVDDVFFTALAKGANRAVKIAVDQPGLGTVATAQVFAGFFQSGAGSVTPDTVVLTGAQAYNDLEGELAPYLADTLGLPYVGVVCGVAAGEGKLTVLKEFSGGLRGEYAVSLPAVLGIQSAEKPPRYVPFAKVTTARKTLKIETVSVPAPAAPIAVAVEKLYKPEAAGRAEMLSGSPEEIAGRIVALLAERGLI